MYCKQDATRWFATYSTLGPGKGYGQHKKCAVCADTDLRPFDWVRFNLCCLILIDLFEIHLIYVHFLLNASISI